MSLPTAISMQPNLMCETTVAKYATVKTVCKHVLKAVVADSATTAEQKQTGRSVVKHYLTTDAYGKNYLNRETSS